MSRLNLLKFRYIHTLGEIKRCYFLHYSSYSSFINKNGNKLIQKLNKAEKNKTLDIDISSSSEIKSFLKSNNMPFKTGFTSYICSCPRHIKRQLEMDQIDKLFINSTTGYFVCKSCGKSGEWQQLKDNISDIMSNIRQKKKKPCNCFVGVKLEGDIFDDSIQAAFNEYATLELVTEEQWHAFSYHFNVKNLNKHILERYCVRTNSDHSSLVFPAFDRYDRVVGFKECRIHDNNGKMEVVATNYPKFGCNGMFGWKALNSPKKPSKKSSNGKNTIDTVTDHRHHDDDDDEDGKLYFEMGNAPPIDLDNAPPLDLGIAPAIDAMDEPRGADSQELVLTSSEMDAVVIAHVTGKNVLALPCSDNNLPQEVLPLLESYTKITIWLGGTMKHWQLSQLFGRKLSDSRCFLIRPCTKSPDAITAYNNNLNIDNILNSARRVEHKSIVSFRNLRSDVFTELTMSEEMQGIKWQNYPRLNSLLKGHRRGELTIFTGPTGCGKTTFISDYSLDLCSQGVNTLWGSFEINNVRLLKTMLSQYSQVNMEKHLDSFEMYADSFEKLPMYFMTFHGQENISNVIQKKDLLRNANTN